VEQIEEALFRINRFLTQNMMRRREAAVA
jgi:hypothetical protein